jgi:hypothetical protein
MKTQNYVNHRRYVRPYHFYSPVLLLLILIGALAMVAGPGMHHGRMLGGLLVLVCLISTLNWFYLRTFATKVQDRAIRSEENFRYFVLTGKPLPTTLGLGQIIGLRFAEDTEFVELVQRASLENLSGEEIKKIIKNWRPDHHRA